MSNVLESEKSVFDHLLGENTSKKAKTRLKYHFTINIYLMFMSLINIIIVLCCSVNINNYEISYINGGIQTFCILFSAFLIIFFKIRKNYEGKFLFCAEIFYFCKINLDWMILQNNLVNGSIFYTQISTMLNFILFANLIVYFYLKNY